MFDCAELDRLLSAYLEGVASASDLAALESVLASEDAAADHASRWFLMHRQIGELLTEDALHAIMDKYVQATPGLPKHVFASAQSAPRSTADADQSGAEHGRRRSWFAAAAAAACVAAVGVAQWQLGAPQGEATDPLQDAIARNGSGLQGEPIIRRPGLAPDALQFDANQNNGTPVGEEIIATVTRLSDAVWAENAAVLSPGDQLAVGDHVLLASGMAKVTFECGAEVSLEGPCDFQIQSQMLGYLNSGKITADVPRRAFGFGILSPGVDFVDLGTSFGVNVGASGDTELHVFEGEVLCSPAASQESDSGEAIHVLANRAVTFAPEGAASSDIAMDAGRFSELRALRRHAAIDSHRLPGDRLALWLAADAAAATDDRDRVISWQDLIYGDNQSAEDAVQADEQARPRLVDDAMNGRPAIRFDGVSDWLLTTPLETTDDQTVFLACQFSQTAFDPSRRWGGQILNYDGPPSRYLSNLLEPGVLQIGEPLLEEQFHPTLVTSQVFAGFVGRATVESGRVDGSNVGADAPVIIGYVYDYGGRRAELFVNGRSQGTARAFAPQGITSRKIIGRHAWMQNFFHGDLAELLIFNKALTPQEITEATAYLADKYSIELESASPGR